MKLISEPAVAPVNAKTVSTKFRINHQQYAKYGKIYLLWGSTIATASVTNVMKIVMGTNFDCGILTGVSRGASGIC